MWYQLTITQCKPESIDTVSEVLETHGALSITLRDNQDTPVLEPALGTTPLWPQIITQALFATATQAQAASSTLTAAEPACQITVEVIPDKAWEKVCMEDFKPQAFGKRLWICPTWSTPPQPDAVNVLLDPGLAFGTGAHATTALCLTWLDAAPLRNKTLIDYGCGSGILALSAVQLGAEKVFAVDIDEQALQATQSNAKPNGIDPSQLAVSFPDVLQQPVDIVLANILLAPLTALKKRFHDLLHTQGTLVVSGLLQTQILELVQAYDHYFECTHQATHDGWALLGFKKIDRLQ